MRRSAVYARAPTAKARTMRPRGSRPAKGPPPNARGGRARAAWTRCRNRCRRGWLRDSPSPRCSSSWSSCCRGGCGATERRSSSVRRSEREGKRRVRGHGTLAIARGEDATEYDYSLPIGRTRRRRHDSSPSEITRGLPCDGNAANTSRPSAPTTRTLRTLALTLVPGVTPLAPRPPPRQLFAPKLAGTRRAGAANRSHRTPRRAQVDWGVGVKAAVVERVGARQTRAVVALHVQGHERGRIRSAKSSSKGDRSGAVRDRSSRRRSRRDPPLAFHPSASSWSSVPSRARRARDSIRRRDRPGPPTPRSTTSPRTTPSPRVERRTPRRPRGVLVLVLASSSPSSDRSPAQPPPRTRPSWPPAIHGRR